MRKLQFLLTMLMIAISALAQQKTITGTVTSNTANERLQGVSVQGRNKTVVTDANGNFSISASAGETITLTYVGMNPQSFKVTNATQNINITMVKGVSDLDEVVITGYKSERKKDLTGAVAVVNMSEVKNIPASSPMLALQGRVPGLYIEADGSPTGGSSRRRILIRGVNTLGDASPLYIIDGVPTKRYEDFANLNSNSIASVQILKDASSASIYGSRASNGVIIVTTKEGQQGSDGREKINVQFNTSISVQTARPWQENVLSSEDRGKALWRAAVNDKSNPNINTAIYQYDWNADYTNPVLNKVNIRPFVGGDSLQPAGNTNWQDALYKTAVISSNNLTVTAGNTKSGFMIDLGYYKNSGLMVFTNYNRYNARINSHTTAFNGKLKIGENFLISRSSQVLSTTDVGGAATTDLAITLSPTIPVYRTDGSYAGPKGAGYSDRNNPVHMQYLNRWNTNNQLLGFGNVYAEIELAKRLVFRTSVGLDYSDLDTKNILPFFNEGLSRTINSLALQETKDFTLTWANTLTYQAEFGKNRLDLLGGTEAIRNDYTTFGAYREGFSSQDQSYFYLNSGTGANSNNGSGTGYRLLSQFGKVNYAYSNRYLASVTVRRDGSSRFGTNNQYGIFPALSIGWRINNEDFFKDVTSISNLKLRAGVGRVGNQEIGNVARFGLYQANYGTTLTPVGTFPGGWWNTGTAYDLQGANGGTLPSGYVSVQAANPNLKWESTDELNVGLDFGFLKERLAGSFDYFVRKTSNILIQPPIASAVGEGQLEWLNGATTSNKGWEFILGYNNSAGAFNYSITGNVSHFENKITYLPPEVRNAYPGNSEQTILGHSQFSIFGYKTEGIFQSQDEVTKHALQPGAGVGRLKFADLNGDGKIDGLDRTWLGTTLPAFEYGLSINLGYKNFDLSIFGSGVGGKKGNDPMVSFNSFASVNSNNGPGVLNAWTPSNTASKIPALSLLNTNNETRTSDYFIVNASYFKLRNIQLGYTMPNSLIKGLKMQALRFYLIGQNLFVLKSKQYLAKDPERVGTLAAWPVPTAVTFGLNVTF